jgi:hypothetical protein
MIEFHIKKKLSWILNELQLMQTLEKLFMWNSCMLKHSHE